MILKNILRERKFPESNYRSIFANGKTIRFTYDSSKEITKIEYPEFYDIAINDLCHGRCSYCYVNALDTGKNYENIVKKFNDFFGPMSLNERPYQIAIGGAGEPTLHPDFEKFVKASLDLEIIPNFTTNGMHLDDSVMRATEDYCGGVAVTCHPHLKKYWEVAIEEYSKLPAMLNVHHIISGNQSIQKFMRIYEKYQDIVDYFVLLPYQPVGRAKDIPLFFNTLFEQLKTYGSIENIAFGALFHPYLKQTKMSWLDLSLYDPEILSKYLDMNKMKLFASSFHTEGLYDWIYEKRDSTMVEKFGQWS